MKFILALLVCLCAIVFQTASAVTTGVPQRKVYQHATGAKQGPHCPSPKRGRAGVPLRAARHLPRKTQ